MKAHLEKYGAIYLAMIVALFLLFFYDPLGLFGRKTRSSGNKDDGADTTKGQDTPPFPLKRGESGPRIRELQEKINEEITANDHPLLPISEDGVFGEETEMAANFFGLIGSDGVGETTFNIIGYPY